MRGRAALLALAVSAGGCSPSVTADRAQVCQVRIGYRPGAAPELAKQARSTALPRVVGSWDGWASSPEGDSQRWDEVTDRDGLAWRTFTLRPPPGTYQYAILVGDQLVLDELNPRTAFVAEAPGPVKAAGKIASDGVASAFSTEVSEVVVPDCTQPALEVRAITGGSDGIELTARFLRGVGGAALDEGSLSAELWRGPEPLAAAQEPTDAPAIELAGSDGNAPLVRVRARGLAPGKYTLRLSARALDGRATKPLTASAFVEARPGRTLADGLVYEIVIDRFRGPSGPLVQPASPGDRAGGTLDGVRAAIDAGYFEQLGVTTLWLSPVYTNPRGHFTGRDGHSYEAYHGYWPAEPRAVEPQLGGEAALDGLIAAAHARGLRVILDAVPNHVYLEHPYYQEHARAAAGDDARADWFNDGPEACVCGAPGCDWDAHLETCWFDRYLPDLDWRNPSVLDAGTSDLAWWTRRFDLDGFRLDAVPAMPRVASRRIVATVRSTIARGGPGALDGLILGENYTGPGEAGRAALRTYLGSTLDGLDSEFDFPLMWAAREVLAAGRGGGFADLEAAFAASEHDFAGSGAVIAHILDNHDTPRFLSVAVGDDGGDPWTAPARQPDDEAPYRRQVLGTAYVLTLPGLPVLYYGQELGLAGANDPDSRRVLPDVLHPASLSALAAWTLDQTARLGRLRGCVAALRGPAEARRVLVADERHLLTLHGAGAGRAFVLLSRATVPTAAPLRGVPAGRYVDALSGRAIEVGAGAAGAAAPVLPVEPLSAAVFLPEDSPCL